MKELTAIDSSGQQYLKRVQMLFANTPVFGETWWQDARHVFDADNLIIREPDSLPYGGNHHGMAGFENLVLTLSNYWRDLSLTDFQFTGAETLVTISYHLSATGVATGKAVSMPFIEVWRFDNDKVVEIVPFYWDTAAILTALNHKA